MTTIPLVLLVDMIGRASGCADATSNQCASLAADNSATDGPDACADTDAFSGLSFARLRIVAVTTLRHADARHAHQEQAGNKDERNDLNSLQFIHSLPDSLKFMNS